MAREKEIKYLDTQADLGITKHLGGLRASRELAELCHLGKGKHVLDVGCGLGLTACRLAKNYGCKVIGMDISAKMIKWSKKNARQENVGNEVEFIVADAQKLLFRSGTFDASIAESVNAFIRLKQEAVREYIRVTKAGGYIGLNEATWLKTPPPKWALEYMATTGEQIEILPADGWRKLLEDADLKDIEARAYAVTARSEAIDRLQVLGLRRILAAWCRLLLYIFRPEYRHFMTRALKAARHTPRNLFEYWGYGIYVGRK